MHCQVSPILAVFLVFEAVIEAPALATPEPLSLISITTNIKLDRSTADIVVGFQTSHDGMTYYNFSNVRYAAPPTGSNRFKPPVHSPKHEVLHTGQQEFICPQAVPGWGNIALAVLSGQNISGTGVPPFTAADIPPVHPRTSEDCLFLDLLVRTAVYKKQDAAAPVVKGVPFSQAIPQSPYLLAISSSQQNSVYQQTLSFAGAASYSQLANETSAQLQLANSLVVGNSAPFGTYAFGPVVDGEYIPDLPGVLLAKGKYVKIVRTIISHCSDEGLLFTSPFITNGSDYSAFLQQVFPGIAPKQLNFISTTLYPANFSGYYGYTSQMGRTSLTVGDAAIVCNARYLDDAFQGQYAYEFTVPPSTHAEDLSYLFYDNGTAAMVSNTTLAVLLQRYITRFAETGSPNAPDLPPFATNENQIVQNLNSSYIGPIMDESISRYRCAYWQEALYRPSGRADGNYSKT
ncbi:Alpha/Beta hydrolase protein [Usnea florida]